MRRALIREAVYVIALIVTAALAATLLVGAALVIDVFDAPPGTPLLAGLTALLRLPGRIADAVWARTRPRSGGSSR